MSLITVRRIATPSDSAGLRLGVGGTSRTVAAGPGTEISYDLETASLFLVVNGDVSIVPGSAVSQIEIAAESVPALKAWLEARNGKRSGKAA